MLDELKPWSKFIQSTERLSNVYKTIALTPKMANLVRNKKEIAKAKMTQSLFSKLPPSILRLRTKSIPLFMSLSCKIYTSEVQVVKKEMLDVFK